VCYHKHSAFHCCNVRSPGVANIRMLTIHILAEGK
jgi:hypothetical protein